MSSPESKKSLHAVEEVIQEVFVIAHALSEGEGLGSNHLRELQGRGTLPYPLWSERNASC